jgi:hypothetical protein
VNLRVAIVGGDDGDELVWLDVLSRADGNLTDTARLGRINKLNRVAPEEDALSL